MPQGSRSTSSSSSRSLARPELAGARGPSQSRSPSLWPALAAAHRDQARGPIAAAGRAPSRRPADDQLEAQAVHDGQCVRGLALGYAGAVLRVPGRKSPQDCQCGQAGALARWPAIIIPGSCRPGRRRGAAAAGPGIRRAAAAHGGSAAAPWRKSRYRCNKTTGLRTRSP